MFPQVSCKFLFHDNTLGASEGGGEMLTHIQHHKLSPDKPGRQDTQIIMGHKATLNFDSQLFSSRGCLNIIPFDVKRGALHCSLRLCFNYDNDKRKFLLVGHYFAVELEIRSK